MGWMSLIIGNGWDQWFEPKKLKKIEWLNELV